LLTLILEYFLYKSTALQPYQSENPYKIFYAQSSEWFCVWSDCLEEFNDTHHFTGTKHIIDRKIQLAWYFQDYVAWSIGIGIAIS